MQSLMIVLLGLAGMTFGWFVYSKFIATKIYQLDPDFVTPANEFNDGVDYVDIILHQLLERHQLLVLRLQFIGAGYRLFCGSLLVQYSLLGFTILELSGPAQGIKVSQLAHFLRMLLVSVPERSSW